MAGHKKSIKCDNIVILSRMKILKYLGEAETISV